MTEQNDNAPADNSASANANEPRFSLQKIYMKDLSFEAPNGLILPKSMPKVSQDLNTTVNKLKEDLYEVILKLTVTVNYGEKVAFLIEVHQAGAFTIGGLDGAQVQQITSTYCANILFPYAREAIDNMAVRGGFPPLALPAINFDALFMQAMSEARNHPGSEATPASAEPTEGNS